MTGKDYGIVAKALGNFKDLNELVNKMNTVEEARSILSSNGHIVSKMGEGLFDDGFMVKYRNIETSIYKHNGMVVADPYIDIYDDNGSDFMEAMFIEDLENGIYA